MPWFTVAGLLAATGAQAVNVSGDGRGEVLLYPYYTTRADGVGNPYGTLLSVVNGQDVAKAVRVRFLEGRNSSEVMSFNLFLPPNAAWLAAIVPDPASGAARIGTLDPACTLPSFSASPTAPFVPFSNAFYSGSSDDGAGVDLDRSKEGFIEVLEMATYPPDSTTSAAITGVDGVPACGAKLTDTQAATDAGPPTGGLYGSVTFTNATSVVDFTVDAIALDNFYRIGANYNAIGSSLPNLSQATPPVSVVKTSNGTLYESLWGAGSADPVSAALMHDSVMNEYLSQRGFGSGTDWVITLPTKRYYTSRGTGNASRLFQRNFSGGGSCDDVSLATAEDNRGNPRARLTPVPAATGSKGYSLCWAANVFTVDNSNLLGSANGVNLSLPKRHAWLSLNVSIAKTGDTRSNARRLVSDKTSIGGGGLNAVPRSKVAYQGLPTIGFAVLSYGDGFLRVSTPWTAAQPRDLGDLVQRTVTGKAMP